MKKKLSKGMMHPMLLDYLLRFGTNWVSFKATYEFRVEWYEKAPSDYLFWQTREFGFIETRKEYNSNLRSLGLLSDEIRLTPKGLRRIARG